MKKTREVIATPEASKNLKAAWNARKKELKLTQELAAELLGFELQGTVSQSERQDTGKYRRCAKICGSVKGKTRGHSRRP